MSWIQPNPDTTNREVWTNAKLDYVIPGNAAPEFRSYVEALQSLERKLAFHSAMRPNLRQTYMTPANLKTKIYFMWDFVDRTLGYAFMLPPDLGGLPPPIEDLWLEVLSRCHTTAKLLLDDPPGRLDGAVDASYPGQTGELPFGQKPVIGEDIKEAARQLEALVDNDLRGASE